jgi:hypothetical protein
VVPDETAKSVSTETTFARDIGAAELASGAGGSHGAPHTWLWEPALAHKLGPAPLSRKPFVESPLMSHLSVQSYLSATARKAVIP